MKSQAQVIGAATLIRSADIAADGLTQMRGATAPRLILELICARILLPGSDDQGLLARLERLENGIAITAPVAKQSTTRPSATQPTVAEKIAPSPDLNSETVETKAPQVAIKPEVKAKVAEPVQSAPQVVRPAGPVDIAALRKFWPEVIENVKKQRRLTWSLLSASAQVLAVDDKAITIGIVNSGARDSFIRSESDLILRKAFAEVVGLDIKIECIVDPSVNASTTTPERTVEDPTDATELSGAELLAKELGAQVIKKFTHDV